jgi:ribosomal protein S18 acetylase RimI-like enzyme
VTHRHRGDHDVVVSGAVPTTIRAAAAADVPVLADALGRAFEHDPGWAWIYPQPDAAARLARMFRTMLDVAARRGATVLTDEAARGAAIWQRADRRSFGTVGTLRMGVAMVASGAKVQRGQRLLKEIERRHPHAPHWYLATLGTDPRHQGGGVGSALVRHVVDAAANAGEAAYLETLTASNVAFYERLGFRVVDELDVPGGGPHVWLMWRDPPAA